MSAFEPYPGYEPDSNERWVVEWHRPNGRLIWSYDFVPAMHTAIPEPNMAHGIILPPWEVTVRRVASRERATIYEETEGRDLDAAYEAGYNAGHADGYNEGHRAGRFSAGSDPALIEAFGDLLNWDVEHDHPSLSYITVQVDRDVVNKAATAWEAAQP